MDKRFWVWTLLCFLCLIAVGCARDYAFVLRETAEKQGLPVRFAPERVESSLDRMPVNIRALERTVFYTSEEERIEVIGKSSGLLPNVKRVYVTLFTDFSETRDIRWEFDTRNTLQSEFDRRLGLELEARGLIVVPRMGLAQAIISGNIRTFDIYSADIITNVDGLIYTMKIDYSWDDRFNTIKEAGRSIEERILVMNTNEYNTNRVMPIMVERMAQFTAEAIVDGWQSEYAGKDGRYLILGAEDENNLSLDR
jgi:hypothetical protein